MPFSDHRISRHLVSVLHETQPFDFFFFFFADIVVKYVARTFQAAIQLPFDMHTPCRVSLAHLSPRNTTPFDTMQVVNACPSILRPFRDV